MAKKLANERAQDTGEKKHKEQGKKRGICFS